MKELGTTRIRVLTPKGALLTIALAVAVQALAFAFLYFTRFAQFALIPYLVGNGIGSALSLVSVIAYVVGQGGTQRLSISIATTLLSWVSLQAGIIQASGCGPKLVSPFANASMFVQQLGNDVLSAFGWILLYAVILPLYGPLVASTLLGTWKLQPVVAKHLRPLWATCSMLFPAAALGLIAFALLSAFGQAGHFNCQMP